MAKESSVGHRLGLVPDCCSGLQQRINFVIPDPSQYDASINLQDVQISDSATYECKVKKTTLASRKVTIMVLERPSVPKCSVVGKVSLGHDVTLCCSSDAGNSPLAYQWARVSGHLHGNTISAFATKGVNPGDIVIKNLSHEHVGLYQCSVANKVGYSQCVLEISLADDSNQMIIVIGVVLGSLLFLILLLCLTMWIIYCVRRRKFKEEVNQIRVDSAPPRGRGGRKSNKNAQRGKYEPPKEQEAVEMLCPTDQDLNSRNAESEVQNKGSTSVITKARVHCPPAIPSLASSQCRVPAPFQLPASPVGTETSTSQRDTAQAKHGPSERCGDIHTIVSARSRKDLVL
ncbi:V-set and immunoglobulin domain-containing protein 8-like [Anolis sagrei]|uniref:V-set and immunoglobulin domain-containing protein 8-like n=1 Tax=Anolis sagrei TaxID=38937 RepID=UPI003521FD0D